MGAPKNNKPVVMVGKGITFDSGGISLKGGAGMEAMKLDMHGAATVIGTMYAAAKAKLPVNLVGLVPATENLPSGSAFLPGDILTYANGVTVEIISTDAEGRLILADGLLYAKRYNPKAVIDFATLTGACVVALGHEAAGLMGTDPALNTALIEAGEQCCEKIWELPLFDEYDEYLKSDVADTKNGGGRAAGTITAARFLKKFAPDVPWAHIDIAGVAMRNTADSYVPKGGTGFGVRLMYRLLSQPSKK
jgi:leucyl aminopeptidase